jgi:hypothetical protein
MYKTAMIAVAAMLIAGAANAQLKGTVWSHTQRGNTHSELKEQTQYYVFTSETKVIVFLSAERNYMYPVGFGDYNPKNQTVTFLDSDPLSIMAGRERRTLTAKFSIKNGQAELSAKGETIIFTKEKYSLTLSSKLTGTKWNATSQYGQYNNVTVQFRTANEVLIDGKVYPYALIGNQLSISFDSDEALLGELHDNSKNRISLYFGSAFNHIKDETSMVLER